ACSPDDAEADLDGLAGRAREARASAQLVATGPQLAVVDAAGEVEAVEPGPVGVRKPPDRDPAGAGTAMAVPRPAHAAPLVVDAARALQHREHRRGGLAVLVAHLGADGLGDARAVVRRLEPGGTYPEARQRGDRDRRACRGLAIPAGRAGVSPALLRG